MVVSLLYTKNICLMNSNLTDDCPSFEHPGIQCVLEKVSSSDIDIVVFHQYYIKLPVSLRC